MILYCFVVRKTAESCVLYDLLKCNIDTIEMQFYSMCCYWLKVYKRIVTGIFPSKLFTMYNIECQLLWGFKTSLSIMIIYIYLQYISYTKKSLVWNSSKIYHFTDLRWRNILNSALQRQVRNSCMFEHTVESC